MWPSLPRTRRSTSLWADSPRRARGTSILPWCQGERAHRARKALAAWDGGVSVTVTWSPAPATERLPAVLQRALAATGHTIASFPAGIAVATIRCLLDRRQRAHPVASSLRRQLASVTRELPRPDRAPGGRDPGHPGSDSFSRLFARPEIRTPISPVRPVPAPRCGARLVCRRYPALEADIMAHEQGTYLDASPSFVASATRT